MTIVTHRFGVTLLAACLFFLTASVVFAADADKVCRGCKDSCAGVSGCKVCSTISCDEGGLVSGRCVSADGGICKATSAKDAGGGSMNVGDLSKLMSALSQIMQALGAGGAGGSGSGSTGSTANTGCTQYYQVSTTTNDPCAYYVPPSVGSGINVDVGSQGSTNTTGNSGDSVGVSVPNLISDILGTGGDQTNTSGVSASSTIPVTSGSKGVVSTTTAAGAKGIKPGASGEIRVLPNGATVIVQNQDTQSNSAVAGFMGNQASGGAQPAGLVASWCRSRPWAANFLSLIIPPVFFDSLCSLRGYQIGQAQQAAPVGKAQIGSNAIIPKKPATQSATSTPAPQVQTAPNVPKSPPMTVDIWAVPATVPLGTRTTIFWNSKNAQSCVETSPDGSFSHNTLSGGGATVPLSGVTTFTISCQAPDGTHATDYVTVNMSI